MTTSRRAAWVAAASAIVVVLATWRSGQGLYSDPALQIKTVQEFLAGTSPHLNGWARPNYSDISSDQIEQLIVWAPGTSFAIAPFMRAGLSPAAAARTVAALALVCGSAGWVYWFGLFDLPYGILMALAIAFPWMRSASNALFLYTSEILVFALVPWTLCLALIADRRRRLGWCLAAGLLAGSLYVVKYSAGFVSAGIVAWLAYRAWRERGAAIAAWLVTTAAVALPVLALTVFNHQFGSANLLTASLGGAFDWRNAVHAVAMPALAAADLDAVLLFVLMHPTHPLLQNLLWISLIGLPGGLLLVVLSARRGVDGPHAALARAVFFVSIAAILSIWTISNAVSIESRHLSSAAFCVLPLALAEGCLWWRRSAIGAKSVLAAAGVGYLVVPLLYGPVSVAAKVVRYPSDFRPGSSGIYNPLFAEHDAARVAASAARDFRPARDVWYLTEPMSALDLPGRAIVVHADFTDLAALRKMAFQTSRPIRVHALLPPRFESNGKGDAIRSSFLHAGPWRHEPLPGSEYDAWVADVRPSRAPE